ncbi:MAG: glutathione S-transferase N-terminal domain-containing protein [Parvibaculum sp.]|jgi:glutathione S-transferase
MKLFISPASPYARKVRVLIREKGATSLVTEELASPLADPQELHAANPLGKVPALILRDGTAVFDSPVICDYLNVTLEGPDLIPTAHHERWRAMRLEAIGDGICDAAVSMVFERTRPEGEKSGMWMDRWRRAITRALDLLETEEASLEAPLDVGGIAVACALSYLDLRHADMNWREGRPKLAARFAEIIARPSFADTAA